MKKGFTMIELIFVIVILGILAAVAIPRLAATRDDAEVAKALTNLGTGITDITTNYVARGELPENVPSVTNVAGFADTKITDAKGHVNGGQVNVSYKVGNSPKCAELNFFENDENEVTVYIGTEELRVAQKKVSDAEAKLAKAQKDLADIGSGDATAAQAAVTAAQKEVADAKAELTKTAGDLSGATAAEDSVCRSLLKSAAFANMAQKTYKLSGSNVKF